MLSPMLRCTFLALIAALASPTLAATGAVPSQPAAIAAGEPGALPPGSAADLELLRAGLAAGEAITGERGRAGILQNQVKGGQLLERLAEAAVRAEPAQRARLEERRARLLEAWERNYDVVTRQWPVDPTRGCGYPVLIFDSALRDQRSPGTPQLAQARGELRECVGKAQAVLQVMAAANTGLETAIRDAEAALGPATGASKGGP